MLLRLSLVAFATACAASAAADDLPARKPGLWQLKMTIAAPDAANLPPVTAEHCIDTATDKLMNVAGGSIQQDSCWKQEVQNAGNAIVVYSVCRMGPSSIRMTAIITGDLNSAYAVRVTTKQVGEPVPGIPTNETMIIDAKWMGACRADQKPGDMIMAGHKTNILDLQKGSGARK
jgi:Protein of unknown function (DUF3617)